MLTIMDLLKKSSASKLEKMVNSTGQPLAFVVASLLENQLNDNTQSIPKVIETSAINPKAAKAPQAAPQESEDGILAVWSDYPKRAARAFTTENITSPKQLVENYTYEAMSELRGVGATTASKVFDKLRDEGFVKSTKDMGKNIANVGKPTNATAQSLANNAKANEANQTNNASRNPQFEAENDEDAVATDWYGKIVGLSPSKGADTMRAARSYYSKAWNISEKEAHSDLTKIGVVARFTADASPNSVSSILKTIANSLPVTINISERIYAMIDEMKNSYGKHIDLDQILSEFDVNNIRLLTIAQADKVFKELEYDLYSLKDAKAHQDNFGSGEDDDEYEDDEDMPF